MRDWKTDLTVSSRLFLDVVWPVIKRKCGGGEIRPVELIQDQAVAKQLDILAGIDLWQTVTAAGVRGIASRVQFGEGALDKKHGCPYDTFTIRMERESGVTTEFDKRTEAIRSGRWMYPYLTVQAYCSEQPPSLYSVAVIRTADLYSYVAVKRERNKACGHDFLVKQTTDKETGKWAKFVYVTWAELTKAGVELYVRRKQGP